VAAGSTGNARWLHPLTGDREATAMSRSIDVVEVGPRDGLQNEDVIVDTAVKRELIERLVTAGVRRLEVTSFVHPDRVPQMADADELVPSLPAHDDVSYIGLVLNERGFDRALAAGVDEVNVVLVASETFCQRNQGVGMTEMLAVWRTVAHRAREAGVRHAVTIGAAWGCPFEGVTPPERVVDIACQALEEGPVELALADTIGVGRPNEVADLLGRVGEVAGDVPLRCHFHNTRNTGYANAYAAVQAGAQALDSSVGGIGGCPFAPAATGNIATEDLIYLLDGMGVHTGVSLAGIVETAAWLEGHLGKQVPALLGRAGNFPHD
jgi:hydroxymethylglutaryl-CoA lyase